MRNRAAVVIRGRLFEMLLTTGNTILARCVSGIPAGATFIASQYDALMDSWIAVFEHEDFPPTPDNEMLPRLEIEYTDIIPPE